jgi:GNAT superfamily N-acetyltransferase
MIARRLSGRVCSLFLIAFVGFELSIGATGFFVHPDWARRGIGRELLQKCEEEARRENFRALELISTRMGEPLYIGAGFEVTEQLEFCFPNGVVAPAARMRKLLRRPEDNLL